MTGPFRAEQQGGATYWSILGPGGAVGWGVEYSEQNAADRVRLLNNAYEAGRTAKPAEPSDDPLPSRLLPATQVGVYDRNRRYGVPAGTKFAIVIVRFDPRRDDTDARRRAAASALTAAIKAYEGSHGPVVWDLAQTVTTHLTGKVAVELRVSP